MTKLNQIIAVEKGVKSSATRRITDLHRDGQKDALLSGIYGTYQPRDEEGDHLPGESTRVQIKAEDVLTEAAQVMTRLFDVTLTKDHANTVARAEVVVDGHPLLRDVPVTYLLFLEKQLTDLHTFVAKLPVLDPSADWSFDGHASATSRPRRRPCGPRGCPVTTSSLRHAAASGAGADVYGGWPVGDWTAVKFSGALPAARVRTLLGRVTMLQQAVKYAARKPTRPRSPTGKPGRRSSATCWRRRLCDERKLKLKFRPQRGRWQLEVQLLRGTTGPVARTGSGGPDTHQAQALAPCSALPLSARSSDHRQRFRRLPVRPRRAPP